MKKIFALIILGLTFFNCANIIEAAPQKIQAMGKYIMGDNDSPKIAKDAARQEAMRSAVEQAGVYVESYSKTKNMELTADEVKMISGAVLKVITEEAVPELDGDVWKYTVYIKAEVDTDNIDLQEMLTRKNELEKLQKERDELKRQNEELLSKYEKADGAEKEIIRNKLEDKYSLSQVFDDCVAKIQRGEQEAAIEDLSHIINEGNIRYSPLAYAYYLRGRAYYEMGIITDAVANFNLSIDTPHDNSDYPIWRCHYYKGKILYEEERWSEAYDELKTAWDNSNRDDPELKRMMNDAYNRANPKRSSGNGRKVDWGNVLGDIVADSIKKGKVDIEDYIPKVIPR